MRIDRIEVFIYRMPLQRLIADSTWGRQKVGYTKYGARDLLERQAADVLQVDVALCGGITGIMKIGALAQAWNIPLAPHAIAPVHTHVVAALTGAVSVLLCSLNPRSSA